MGMGMDMELRINHEVNLKLLSDIESVAMSGEKGGIIIGSLGDATLHSEHGHVFNGMVLYYTPNSTDKLVKVLDLIEAWRLSLP